MSIVVNLDVMLAKRKIRGKELAIEIGITEQNLSLLRTGKLKAYASQHLSVFAKFCSVSLVTSLNIIQMINFSKALHNNLNYCHRAWLHTLTKIYTTAFIF